MAFSVRWHGHATLSLSIDGAKVVVDPFFDDCPSARTKAKQIDADYILISHGHGDHVGDCMQIAGRTDALVISNFEICNWVTAQGHANVHAQHIGGAFNHPFGRVKLTVAFHGSALPDGSYGGMPAGFLIEAADKRVYIAGDTALFSDMQLIGRGGLDLAILPIGDNFTIGPEDALQAVQFLNPALVIPYHYNTWPPIVQDVKAWADSVRSETNSQVVVLEIDESYTL